MAQPQLLQVKLSRFDAQPWGFRLQGGIDFAAPLLVQKVNGGSLAEQAGLIPGDAVIKINDVDVFNLRHKDAQDIVVRSGNNFVITIQRGGSTWRPHVTPTGQVPQPNQNSPYLQTVTKTSLAHKQQDSQHIGCGYNNAARPFVNGGDGSVKSIVNKQYNTPVGIYSDESIAETLSAQAEVLAGGVLGVNFKKNEKEYQADKSEVLKFLREEETGQSTPGFNSHQYQDTQYQQPQQHQYQQPPQQQPPPQQQQQQQHQHQYHHQQQQQQTATRHVSAPINAPKPPSTGGLPTGQNICFECERLITGVFVRIKDKNLHVECFKCATCGTSLKNQGYYNFNNKLYCEIHAKLAALQNPPPGTEGYVPVPIKPNTKLSANTVSAALNAHGYPNGVSNGNSTPTPAAAPVNQGYARPYGASVGGPPAAAPKSPISYPPPQQQQQQQQQQQWGGAKPAGNPYATLPRTNVGQDEHLRPDQSQTPTRPYTPTTMTNKPAPIIPFYQTTEKLCFDECPATHARAYDLRAPSPLPDRARSPAPGPPPNPLSAIRAPRMKDAEMSTRMLPTGSITTGQSYLGAQQQAQQHGQLVSHFESTQQAAAQSYTEQPETIEERKIGDLTMQKREKQSHLEEQKQSQMQSQTTTQIGNTQIERRRKVTEEFEHTQSAKTIEIRTGSQSSSITASATSAASAMSASASDHRQSYGKTGYVANQARRLSGLEQEITNLTSQSQAISARAANMSDSTFPQFRSPEPSSKFPTKPMLPHYDEPTAPSYVFSPSSSSKLVNAPPGFQSQQQQQQQQHQQFKSQQQFSNVYGASVVSATQQQQQQQRQQQKSLSAFSSTTTTTSSSSQSNAVSSSSLTNAYATNNKEISAANAANRAAMSKLTSNNAYRSTASAAGFKPTQAIAAAAAAAAITAPTPPANLPTVAAAVPARAPASASASVAAAQTQLPAPKSAASLPPSSVSDNTNVNGSSGAGGKGGAFGATSAPKRGRGLLNKAVGPGVRVPLCNNCNMQIRGPFITALGRIWCPDHFICVNGNCRRPLQDIGFVEEKGDLYCEYCFEKYLAPTCSKCGGKIKGDCLNAIGKHFHPECFNCAHCGKLFGNTPFFLEDGNAYCEADWNELFTTKCFACGFPVEAGDRWVEALNHNYHSQCFNCTYCKQNLEGQSFYNKGGRPFCKNHAR